MNSILRDTLSERFSYAVTLAVSCAAAALEVAVSGRKNATTAEMAKEAMANWIEAVKLPEVSAR